MMAAAALAVAVPAHAADTPLEQQIHGGTKVLIVSHRSCWKRASENSLDGIAICAADGIDMAEIDVRTTRDGHLVLMHDETVDRTTNGHGAVADLTAAYIASLRLKEHGGGPDAPLTQRRVPTFAEALAAVRGRVLMNIDVKAASLTQIIDDVVAAHAERDVVLNVPIDVDPQIMDRARRLGIACQVLYLEQESKIPLSDVLQRASELRPEALQLIFENPQVVWSAKQLATSLNGPRLWVNTMAHDIATGKPMNLAGPYLDTSAADLPDQVWGALVRQGVTMIQTDEPWKLQAWLKAKELR
jgi:glycerophosphoryl diester phosphodiesterase